MLFDCIDAVLLDMKEGSPSYLHNLSLKDGIQKEVILHHFL